MKRSVAFGLVAVAGLLAFGLGSKQRRERLGASMAGRVRSRSRMQHMIDILPDDAPPKLVAAVLPRLRVQSDEMLKLLREQNTLLRERV